MTNWTVGLRSRSCALAILLATCATTYAQTGPTGTWRVEAGSQSGWEVFLRADAQKLTGLVNYCATALPQRADIYDGNIAGNTITLKCTSPDRDRMRAVTDKSAWLGNNQTGEAAPYRTFAGSKGEASWLPDEASARAWQKALGLGK
jgi:hypothetical protein